MEAKIASMKRILIIFTLCATTLTDSSAVVPIFRDSIAKADDPNSISGVAQEKMVIHKTVVPEPDAQSQVMAPVEIPVSIDPVLQKQPPAPDRYYYQNREQGSVFPGLSLAVSIVGVIGHFASLMTAISSMDETTWMPLAGVAVILDIAAVVFGALGFNKRNNTPAVVGFVIGLICLMPAVLWGIAALSN